MGQTFSSLTKDIIRFIMINVSEGGGRVKGQWMEMTNDTWHPINKKFILNINQTMRKDILGHFWGLSAEQCGTNYLETINILCTKFALTTKPININDVVMQQMRKICIYLKDLNKFDVANLTHDRLFETPAMFKSGGGFVELYELFEPQEIFLEWMVEIWEYLLSGMIASKNMKQFNDIYFGVVQNWFKKDSAKILKNWNTIDNKIQKLKQQHSQICNPLCCCKEFITDCITLIKEAFIMKTRSIIVNQMRGQVDFGQIIITAHYAINIFSSALWRVYRFLEKYKHGLYLPSLKRVIASDLNDPRIPDTVRQRKEGNMKTMNPDFIRAATESLKQMKGETEILLQYDTSPNLNPIIKRIMSRQDVITEFGTLFVQCELQTLIDKQVMQKYNYNIKDCSIQDIQEKIFIRLMKSALNTSGYKHIRDKNFSKPFVPLRIRKKLDSMNANKTSMCDPFAII